MAKFQISGVIDLKEVEHIDPSQLIKVAVTRNCQVIQSVLVKQQEEMRQFKWEIAFETQTERPVGVNVVAGPDVPDERMGSAEAYKVRVPARAFENGRARVELAISDRIYRRWLAFCRTYTLRGRVVCRQLRWDAIEQQFIPCESPVRGALVTAYDVDRIWWWCRSGAVGSDYTDLNGNFEIEFRWCCWSWGPWYLKDWRVDPALVRRIQELSKLAATPIPLPAPSLELDLGIFDSIASRMEIERLDAPAAQPSAASPQRITEIGRQLAARLPAAGLRELRVWPWWPHWDCRPDIIFKATQDCGEGEVVIYEEGCGDARWNVPAELPGITLVANENACCAPCCTQPPDEDCLVFQGVGCGGYPMTQIEQDMASALVGYGNPGNLDRPFGHTIRLLGMFGDGSAVDFYKLQRRRYLPATATWTAWGDIPADQLASFTRLHWLGWPPPLHLPQTVAPQLVDGEMVIKTTRRFRAENPAIVTPSIRPPTTGSRSGRQPACRSSLPPATRWRRRSLPMGCTSCASSVTSSMRPQIIWSTRASCPSARVKMPRSTRQPTRRCACASTTATRSRPPGRCTWTPRNPPPTTPMSVRW